MPWKIDELLYGSWNPCANELESFTHVVSFLHPEDAQVPNYDVDRFHPYAICVRDNQAPTIRQLVQFVILILTAPEASKFLIHCEGGTGRTGTFAAAYLIAKGATAAEAIERIRNLRPGAILPQTQAPVLYEFEKYIRLR